MNIFNLYTNGYNLNHSFLSQTQQNKEITLFFIQNKTNQIIAKKKKKVNVDLWLCSPLVIHVREREREREREMKAKK